VAGGGEWAKVSLVEVADCYSASSISTFYKANCITTEHLDMGAGLI